MNADLAGDVAISALKAAGIDDAEVVGTPTEGVYQARLDPPADDPDNSGVPADDEDVVENSDVETETTEAEPTLGPEVPVWVVVVSVDGNEIEMKVDDEDGQLVYVDDLIGEDDSERALDDEQWSEIRVYRDDHADRWVRRNIAGSIAAAAVVGVGFVMARRTGELSVRRKGA